MKLKTIRLRSPHRRRKGRATSLWNILTGKWGKQHRLPAHVTGEGDWEVEVPQIRMSRAFAVMLVLHIVAVGGLFAFRIWGRDAEKKDSVMPGNMEVSTTGTDTAALVSAPQVSDTSSPPDASAPAEPLKIYTWHAGDTLQLVAARFNVSGSALREANPGKELAPGTEIVVPRAGRIIGGADIGTPTGQAAAIFDPTAPKETASASQAPRAEMVPELSSGGIPDVIPAPVSETPRPVVQKVSTQIAGKTGSSKTNAKLVDQPSSKSKSKTADTEVIAKPKAKVADTETTSKSKSKVAEADTPPKTKPKASDTSDTPARSGGQRVHVVSKGDTVFNVAKRFGFTAAEIAKANGLNSDYRIQLGQQLRIPVRR